MTTAIGDLLLSLAGIGVLVLAAQHLALRRHLRRPVATVPAVRPGISILKPLCGVDDRLEENLAAFAALDHPRYEVVLGVRSPRDPAFDVARAAVRRWPERMRLVVQRGEPGLNPKVNQLVGLARAARHDLLVVSDSNVRVGSGYLGEIAEAFADPAVGLVTHPVAGEGERRLGSLLENLHLAGAVGPGMVAAQRLGGRDVVVGKSMALRRADLRSLGGFEAVKDVLAEDYVLGLWVSRRLGKRVVVGRTPVMNVNEDRRVRDFFGRYARWGVMQRKLVGTPLYAAQVVLNPVLLAAAGAVAAPAGRGLAALGAICAAKAAIDGASARLLRPGGFRLRALALVPVKDLIFGAAWAHGLVRDEVDWRGNRLRVLPGSRLAPVEPDAPEALGAAEA
ncbi:MAG TPA: ceramide glucosyltransferase [Anaeromyxobacter sp.]|nr:ceramide glucosyltransferase [Anaeromyxobacter sp.]